MAEIEELTLHPDRTSLGPMRVNQNENYKKINRNFKAIEDFPQRAQDAANVVKAQLESYVQQHPPVLSGNPSNLFNPALAKRGYYIASGSGREVAAAAYSASGFIPIVAGYNITVSRADQMALYDNNLNYVRGFNNTDYTTGQRFTFKVPDGVSYLRITMFNSAITTFQVVVGSELPPYSPYPEIKTFAELWEENKIDPLKIAKHLENPFVRTKIKFVGDSITAGVGGTGYSATGEFMFTDTNGAERRANISTATCFANSIKADIEEMYNDEVFVELNHPAITLFSNPDAYDAYMFDQGVGWRMQFLDREHTKKKYLGFSFYGTGFKLNTATLTSGGIIDIFSDGSLHTSIDLSAQATTSYIDIAVSGLTLGYHNIEIRSAGRPGQNGSGTGTAFYLFGLKIQKYTVVKNWGISGIQSGFTARNRSNFIENDDDFILLQVGTNDRQREQRGITGQNLREFIKYAQNLGKELILMSANPTSSNDENQSSRYRNQEDMNNIIAGLASENNLFFISNHGAFSDYLFYTEKQLSTLLADGLHPNDGGYEVIRRNVNKTLGLATKTR